MKLSCSLLKRDSSLPISLSYQNATKPSFRKTLNCPLFKFQPTMNAFVLQLIWQWSATVTDGLQPQRELFIAVSL